MTHIPGRTPPPPPHRTPALSNMKPAQATAPVAPTSTRTTAPVASSTREFNPEEILRSEEDGSQAKFDRLIQARPTAPRVGVFNGPGRQVPSVNDSLNALTRQGSNFSLDCDDALERFTGASKIEDYFDTLLRPLDIDRPLEKAAWTEIRQWALEIENVDDACRFLDEIYASFERRNLLNPNGGKLLLEALCANDVRSLAALRDRLIPDDSKLHAAMVENNYGNPGSSWSQPTIRLDEISAAYSRIAEVDPELAEQLSLQKLQKFTKQEIQRVFLKLGLELSETNAAQALKAKTEDEAEAIRRKYAIQKDVLLIWNCYKQAGLV